MSALLLAMMLFTSLYLRISLMGQNIDYDEAYTYLVYISQGFFASWFQYNLPNNHIFNSIQGVLSSSLFGPRPEILRLFPFIFGFLSLPLFYFVLKNYFTSRVAFLASVISWCCFPLVHYSAQARGYSSQVFFFYLSLWLFLNFRSRWAYVFSILSMGLAFFSIPTTLFALMVMGLVFLLQGQSWKKIFWWGAGVGFLSAFLYFPAMIYALTLGTKSFAFKDRITFEILSEKIMNILSFINPTALRGAVLVQVGFVVLGLLLALRLSKTKALSWGFLLGLPALIFIYPSALVFERLWIWIIPFFFAFACFAGETLLNWGWRDQERAGDLGLVLLLCFALMTLRVSFQKSHLDLQSLANNSESLFLELEKTMNPGDFFLASQSLTTELDYWAKVYGKEHPYSRFLIDGDWKYSMYRLPAEKSILQKHIGENKFYLLSTGDEETALGQTMVRGYLQEDESNPADKVGLQKLELNTTKVKVFKLEF